MSDPSQYGQTWAPIYDEIHAFRDPAETVERLCELARGGRALELGIGTGRVALPLAARGVEVHGVDASEAMVERLRSKPGGAAIPVTIGDFATTPGEGQYELVFIVFSTLYGC